MSRYLKFIQNVNHIPKVCILPIMTMLGLMRTPNFTSGGSARTRRSVEGLPT